jgi:hypothetical protein
MGLRGPLPKTDSTRTRLANGGRPAQPRQESIEPPAGLSPEAADIFRRLVETNRAAQVEILAADAPLYAILADALARRNEPGLPLADWLSLSRFALAAAGPLALGPASRARLGIGQPAADPPESPVAKVLRLAAEHNRRPWSPPADRD